jgi:cation:H+ antiporter
MSVAVSVGVIAVGAGAIVLGAELFAEHLAAAAARLGVTSFALALLLAGAEPEELATAVTATLRDAPGVAFGDVIGANVTICLVALGAAALVAAVPFGITVRLYAFGGLVVGAVAGGLAWDGELGRAEGSMLIAFYVVFVAVIWWRERRPPSLGESAELELANANRDGSTRRVGRELGLAVLGVVVLGLGSIAIVEAVVRLTDVEHDQTALGLTLVGFATAAELVVLAWSTARRGIPETVVAAVVGSFAYNVTMSLGAAALARPLSLTAPSLVRIPWLIMLASLSVVIVISWRRQALSRLHGLFLLALYPLFVLAVIL